jgi:SAM-dependent methyltransferase
MTDPNWKDPFWERADVVARFAAREPDHRLVGIVETIEDPSRVTVLDVGCAAGRNTVFLAERGFDVHAVDASLGMVEETRRRLASILGVAEASRRARVGRMDDLSFLPPGAVDLVVALGIFQNARSMDEWHGAVGESARVLRPGGRLLVAHFTPDVDLTGDGVMPRPAEPHVFDGMPGGAGSVLLHADELDREMGSHGLEPLTESEAVVVALDVGQRATVNALYVLP